MFERARLRLTAWYVSLLALLLIVFDVGVLSIMNQGLQANLADDLQRKAAQASAAIVDLGGSTYFDRNQLASDPGWADVSLFATTTSGTVTANLVSGSVLPDRPAMDAAMSGRSGVTTVGSGRNAFAVYSQPIYSRASQGTSSASIVGVVQVARSMRTVSDAITGLVTLLLAASAAALMVAFVAGLWLAGRTLRPIRESLLQQKQFVSDASHELRTPVTVIRTAAEAMLRQRHPTGARVRELAQDILAESVQLGSLVGDLGTLAEADSRAEVRHEPVDVTSLLRVVSESGAIQAEARGVRLEPDLNAAGVIDGDSVRLRQLFSILIDNATKFAPVGTAVELRADSATGRLRVAVRDHGPGIAHVELPRIFDRFYRGEKERQREGSGLGLAIAQWIAEAHRGVISVRSTEGSGAEFIVELPLNSDWVSGEEPAG
jgi:two-component system sensor histidine kinase CiaH